MKEHILLRTFSRNRSMKYILQQVNNSRQRLCRKHACPGKLLTAEEQRAVPPLNKHPTPQDKSPLTESHISPIIFLQQGLPRQLKRPAQPPFLTTIKATKGEGGKRAGTVRQVSKQERDKLICL